MGITFNTQMKAHKFLSCTEVYWLNIYTQKCSILQNSFGVVEALSFLFFFLLFSSHISDIIWGRGGRGGWRASFEQSMARQGVELYAEVDKSSQYKGRGNELERPIENKPNALSHLLSLFALTTCPRPDTLRICMYVCKDETSVL